MKTKVYKVWPKNNPENFYMVDAPCAFIARWCGANLVNNDYAVFLSAKDMKAERFTVS